MTRDSTNSNKRYFFIMLAVYAAWIALYYFTAWIGSLRGAVFNAELPVDSGIPYIPALLPVYYLAYVVIPGIFLVSGTPAFLNRAYITIIAANGIAFLIFILAPVMGPERAFDTASDPAVQWMVNSIHVLDSRYNAFPSLHVTNPWLLAFLSIRHRGWSWITVLFVILAIAISAATMLVKQHYLIDVVGGVILALMTFAVCSRLRISDKPW